MSVYQRIFSSILYPAYESGLRRRHTLSYLKEYMRQQWLSADALTALQTAKLRALLAHCQTNVPYWRRRFGELGFSWQDLRSPADMAALPVMTKDEIRANYDALIADDLRGTTMRLPKKEFVQRLSLPWPDQEDGMGSQGERVYEELVRLGVLQSFQDGSVDVPDLYRYALEIKRVGRPKTPK